MCFTRDSGFLSLVGWEAEDDDKEVLDAFDFIKTILKLTRKFVRILRSTIHVAKEETTKDPCIILWGLGENLFSLKQKLDSNNYNPTVKKFNFSDYQQSLRDNMDYNELIESAKLLNSHIQNEKSQLEAFTAVSENRNSSKRPASSTADNIVNIKPLKTSNCFELLDTEV